MKKETNSSALIDLLNYSYFGYKCPSSTLSANTQDFSFYHPLWMCHSDPFPSRVIVREGQPQRRQDGAYSPTIPLLSGAVWTLGPQGMDRQWAGLVGGKGEGTPGEPWSYAPFLWALSRQEYVLSDKTADLSDCHFVDEAFLGSFAKQNTSLKQTVFGVLDLQMANPIWGY